MMEEKKQEIIYSYCYCDSVSVLVFRSLKNNAIKAYGFTGKYDPEILLTKLSKNYLSSPFQIPIPGKRLASSFRHLVFLEEYHEKKYKKFFPVLSNEEALQKFWKETDIQPETNLKEEKKEIEKALLILYKQQVAKK